MYPRQGQGRKEGCGALWQPGKLWVVGIGGEDVVDQFENMNVIKEATIGRLVVSFIWDLGALIANQKV